MATDELAQVAHQELRRTGGGLASVDHGFLCRGIWTGPHLLCGTRQIALLLHFVEELADESGDYDDDCDEYDNHGWLTFWLAIRGWILHQPVSDCSVSFGEILWRDGCFLNFTGRNHDFQCLLER